ncbi:MAG: hypothetical protein DYG94_01495 [Leptolyngbya sp. PLA3]|nr:MAG: hypothetical protein EDM82_00390 [Cyanobacteria bacterium CYA]MCE7967405.1 hypothetical protein [Leptolyngbya sp. PL-A3]
MSSWNEHSGRFTHAAGDSVRRVFLFAGQRSSLPTRILVLALVLAFFTIGLIILIPFLAIAAAIVGLLWVSAKIRGVFGRARAPGGALDQRRNVRVIRRDTRP